MRVFGKIAAISVLVTGAATIVTITSGSAVAEPRNCVLNQWATGASAHCDGDGTYILEVDCFGMNLAGGPPFGPYDKSVTGWAGDPAGRPSRDCLMPTTLGQVGIVTGVRITQTPTRPGLPDNAWEYDPGRP
ncbi:hypothetical protein [Nocardia sp. NBC_01329]|uniref:hypothetical protein n=1 Tax=Nocardia sp. NBC_01329 TaxID=2903594 RepID=UPI002E0EB37F|nr:hypothetical protein OG405_13475 [Nocardia sp. NBC_01329]